MIVLEEKGQALVLTLIFLTVLLGLAAAVMDVGSWYRADRKLQANADAAALAGAQALPDDAAQAVALALEYANTKNDGGLAAEDVSISSVVNANDTITVEAERSAPTAFASLFGLDSVNVAARAVARTGTPNQARWAAPVAVDEKHPKLQCKPQPCFGEATVLDFYKVGPGAFRLINIDSSRGGTGPQILGEWIRQGLDAYMPLQWYYSDPGMKPDSSHIRDALKDRLGTELLFPIYRGIRAQGAGFEYEVIGWAGFRVTGYEIHGSKDSKIFGSFEKVIWEGILSESAEEPGFGVRSIKLIE
jgi:Putative Flp pilus-assembly TadE/G-like